MLQPRLKSVFHNYFKHTPSFLRFLCAGSNSASSANRWKAKGRYTIDSLLNTVKVVIAGNGGKGQPNAIFVTAGDKTYLFNCGEGTQRQAMELGLKLRTVDNVFVTRRIWENIGGLPGLSLSLQGFQKSSLLVHGPPNLDLLYELTSLFGITANFNVTQYDYSKGSFADDTLSITSFVLREDKNTDGIWSKNDPFGYFCKFFDLPPKLSIPKCIQLKVPKGPHLLELEQGKNIVLPDGRILTPMDVCDPRKKGPLLWVVDCPSSSYIKSLHKTVVTTMASEDICGRVLAVVHLTPMSVIQDETYNTFVSSFPPGTLHLGVNADVSSLSCLTGLEVQTQLNLIDSEIFPKLKCPQSESPVLVRGVNIPKFGTSYLLRSTYFTGVKHEDPPGFDEKLCVEKTLSSNEFIDSLSDYQNKCKSVTNESNVQVYPCLTFLGTGATAATKRRNLSCILLHTDSKNSIMFDCGEYSYGQFVKLFGADAENELQRLKLIFISHLHADHHLGLITLLKERNKLTNDPLLLILPNSVANWLRNYNQEYENIAGMYRSFSQSFCENHHELISDLFDIGLVSLKCVPVKHCVSSYGIVVRTKGNPGSKIVYSGDAMPTQRLIEEGKNCDILIHEATFDDGMEEDAQRKKHSTISQAVNVGKEMNAKYIFLTHFSSRYKLIPVLEECHGDRVACAFDNMRVAAKDVKKVPLLFNCLKVLFADEYQEALHKKEKRTLKRIMLNKKVYD